MKCKKTIKYITILFPLTLVLGFITLYNDTVFSQDSTNTRINKKCKCTAGKKWNGKKCIKKSNDEVCILLFDPVCGCDGMTYSNSCFAGLAGIKKFEKGECQ